MIKVLYVAPEYPNANQNATQVRASQLLPRLAKHVNLHVLGFGHTAVDESSVANFSLRRMTPRAPGFVTICSSKPAAFFRYAFPEALAAFTEMVYEIKPDIVHFDSIATFGLYEVLLSLNLEHKPMVVFHPHDAVSRLYASQISKSGGVARRTHLWMQLQKIKHVEKVMYPQADLCLVDSKEDANLLQSLSTNTYTRVLPLGFDEAVFHPGGYLEAVNHPCVVFSGAMGEIQSVDAVMQLCHEIMPLVWGSIPDVHVYLVGSNPTKDILQLQDDKRIHVTGFVNDLAAYLRAADVYACPLKLGSGMRTRIVEALACGCAMVVTPEAVVGLSETKEQDVWLLANEADEFAIRIIHLLDDEDARKKLKHSASKFAMANYSWTKVSEHLVSLYRSVIQKKEDSE
jgi:glycosyltransferase involved in cell wall biosynthesis